MVNSCAAFNCSNRYCKDSGISFHCFPKNESLRRAWIVATKRIDYEPSLHAKLCSVHFTDSDFYVSWGRKLLRKDAVPSVFDFSDHLKKPPVMKRSSRYSNTSDDSVDVPEVFPNEEVNIHMCQEASTSTSQEGNPSYAEVFLNEDVDGDMQICHHEEASTSEEGNTTDAEVFVKEEVKIQISHHEEASTSLLIQGKASDDFQQQICIPRSYSRKRGLIPVYFGDIDKTYLEDATPAKLRKVYELGAKRIKNQQLIINRLKQQNKRSRKRIKSLKDVLKDLKAMNKWMPL